MALNLNLTLLLVLLLAACTKTQEEPPPPPPQPKPIPGKPAPVPVDDCGIEEKTGKGLPKSTLENTLSQAISDGELATLNELCGDTWCEGSFEYYFHGLRCDAKQNLCHLDVRMYDRQRTKKKVQGLKMTGKGFTARVLAQTPRDCCTHPGISDNIEPCTTYDARCEIKTKVVKGEEELPWAFADSLSKCLNALEDGIRKIVPEFSEEPE
jgi:hypothetical protein